MDFGTLVLLPNCADRYDLKRIGDDVTFDLLLDGQLLAVDLMAATVEDLLKLARRTLPGRWKSTAAAAQWTPAAIASWCWSPMAISCRRRFEPWPASL